MEDFSHTSQSLRSVFAQAELSLGRFVDACDLIFREQEDLTSSEELGLFDSDLDDFDFLATLEILDQAGLIDLKGKDYVILATEAEFQAGVGQILTMLLGITHEAHRFTWSIEDKMVIIKEQGTVRFSTSIFFRWVEVFLYTIRNTLFVDKHELLQQFSLMTESRNNYCVHILEQQELVIDTTPGIFVTVHPAEIQEWLDNMRADLEAGYDLGS